MKKRIRPSIGCLSLLLSATGCKTIEKFTESTGSTQADTQTSQTLVVQQVLLESSLTGREEQAADVLVIALENNSGNPVPVTVLKEAAKILESNLEAALTAREEQFLELIRLTLLDADGTSVPNSKVKELLKVLGVDPETDLTQCEEKLSELLAVDPDDARLICDYLQGIGREDQPLKALAEWCNTAYGPDDNAFRDAVKIQLEKAIGSSLAYNRLQINPTTRSALDEFGCTTKEQLRKLDVDKFVKSEELFDAFHNLIFDGLLSADYAGLNALVVNPWRDLDLYVDGLRLGEIKKSPAEKIRKFCLWLPENDVDGNRFVDVGIKFPTDIQGNAPLRFQKSVQLQRGVSTPCRINPYPTPALSIGVRSQNSTGTAVVLAGDPVTLQIESPIESDLTDIVWMELGGRDTNELKVENILNPPTGSDTAKGLMAWLQLRNLVMDDQSRSDTPTKQSQQQLLSGRIDEERFIGFGNTISWIPQVESSDIGIVALARNQSGLWGIVKRSFAVIDLRPAVWALPQTDVEIPQKSLKQLSDQSSWTGASTAEVVSGILRELQFTVPVGSPVAVSLHTNRLSEAQMPIQQIVVDFGDGTPPVELAERKVIDHTWQSGGQYVMKITATGIDGISRVMSTNITASLPQVAVQMKPKDKKPVNSPVETSSELFARAAQEWSQELSQAVAATLDQQKWTLEISHIHTELNRPVVELFDGHLMTSLLNAGCQVAERDRVFTEAVEYYGSTTSQNMFGESMNNLPKLPKDLDEKIERWLLNNDNEVGTDEFFQVARFYIDNMETLIQSERDAQSEGDADEPKNDRLVLAYKLSEAGVKISEVGAGLAVRECQIQGFARVFHPESKKVLFSQEIVTTISGIVSKPRIAQPRSEGWNDRPSDWMLNLEPEMRWESPTKLKQ